MFGVEHGPCHHYTDPRMSAQGGDLLAWLDTAITRREQAAREAARFHGPRWVRPIDTDKVRFSDDGIWFQALSDEIAEHIVYNSPESVLRRCAADRKLLESLKAVIQGDYIDDGEPVLAERVLELVAEGYGWTEGER